MTKEYIILISFWIITIISLILFIPRKKVRIAHTSYLFKLLLTWLFGLFVVEFRLIEYPIHEFKYANNTSFTFEYFVYPAICSLFNVHYPANKSILLKVIYYSAFPSIITIIEVILERYTQLINYIDWTWYWTWITLLITFILSRLYVRWFFRIKS